MLKICFLFFSFLSSLGNTENTTCEIPKELALNQEITLPFDCTIQKLQLDKKKFSIVPLKQPPSEVDNGHRIVGLNKEGLILNVTAEGTAFWIMKTEPWKESGNPRIFFELMKEQFTKTPAHKKMMEKAK